MWSFEMGSNTFYPSGSQIQAQTSVNDAAVRYVIQNADCPYRVIGKEAAYCATAPGETYNTLANLVIDNNWLERLNEGGVRIYAGIIEHPGVLVANNLIQNVTVSNNQISDSTEYGQGICIAGSWHSAWAAECKTTPSHVTNNQIDNMTPLGNIVRRMHEGLTLYGGDGPGTMGNTVIGVGIVNLVQDSIFHNHQISTNVNGASGNTLSWE